MEKINSHVEKLHRFLPFSPIMEQIYEEYSHTKDSIDLDTVALEYLLEIVKEKDTKVVILTGDAGHGKTHLCRRLLEEHLKGSNIEDLRSHALELINSSCDGSVPIGPGPESKSSMPLRIYKDFSEFSIDIASAHIEQVGINENEITIICANEGRLRAVLESTRAGPFSKEISESFKLSFENGLASQDGEIHIINLNYQSVAATEGDLESLMERTVKSWVDGTRWRICDQCSAQALCPLSNNQRLLSRSKSKLGSNRQQRLVDLFATSERLGVVITIREMLMSVAYILTGGLRCSDVHQLISGKRKGWQYKYCYHNLVFEAPNENIRKKLSKIPIVNEFGKLDPGKIASRKIDESLVNEHDIFPEGELDLFFRGRIASKDITIDGATGIDDIIGNPRSKSERDKEASFIIKVLRTLRRRYFFDQCKSLSSAMEQMGFCNGSYFIEIMSSKLEPSKLAPLKNKIICGLHMVQGLKFSSGETNLRLVDPAFGRSTTNAAIIARKITSSKIKLIPMNEKWNNHSDSKYLMINAVDWIDRHVVLRIENAPNEKSDLYLDLMLFDFLMRSSSGYVGGDFYAHDIRKIRNFLGCLAEINTTIDQQINLFKGGKTYSISIDDGVIQVGSQ